MNLSSFIIIYSVDLYKLKILYESFFHFYNPHWLSDDAIEYIEKFRQNKKFKFKKEKYIYIY